MSQMRIASQGRTKATGSESANSRDRVVAELAQHAGREGQQGHERQVDDGQGDEAPVDRRQPGHEAMVRRQ
jgi:hypothetical protein